MLVPREPSHRRSPSVGRNSIVLLIAILGVCFSGNSRCVCVCVCVCVCFFLFNLFRPQRIKIFRRFNAWTLFQTRKCG